MNTFATDEQFQTATHVTMSFQTRWEARSGAPAAWYACPVVKRTKTTIVLDVTGTPIAYDGETNGRRLLRLNRDRYDDLQIASPDERGYGTCSRVVGVGDLTADAPKPLPPPPPPPPSHKERTVNELAARIGEGFTADLRDALEAAYEAGRASR